MPNTNQNRQAEGNLLFASLGLNLGILNRDKVIRAFTEWVLDKNLFLGDLLIDQKAITIEQKFAIERAVEIQIENVDEVEEALASQRNAKDLESDLDHLKDQDIKQSFLKVNTKQNLKPDGSKANDFNKYLQKNKFDTMNKLDDCATESAQSDPSLNDRFQREEFLDAGNLGEVWLAKDTELNRTVVVKYIKNEQSKTPLNNALFHLEGEVTGYLEHPNITPVYGLGKDYRDRNFYAMRYIQGRKMTKTINEYHNLRKINPSKSKVCLIDLLQSFQSACLAINYAHTRGVIHCDLKPDNIMIGDFGETMVVDWGLVLVKLGLDTTSDNQGKTRDAVSQFNNAKFYQPSLLASGGLHEQQGGKRDYVGGTPAYMAPEQLIATRGGDLSKVNFSSDIFALGSVLYEILTNRAPLLPDKEKKETRKDYFDRVEKGIFPKPRSIVSGIPKSLEAIVLKAMALDQNQRYASAGELADDVKRWVSDEPVIAYPESNLTRIGRWVKRNRDRTLIGFGVFIFCLTLSSYFFWLEKQRTHENFLKAQKIGQSLMRVMKDSETVYAANLGLSPGRKDAYSSTAKAFQTFLPEFPNNISLLATYGDVSRYLAGVHRYDNEMKEALEHYANAIKTWEKLQKIDPDSKSYYQNQLCGTQRELAGCMNVQGKIKEAKLTLEKSLEIAGCLLEESPNDSNYVREKALVLHELAGISLELNENTLAEKMAKESASLFAQLLEDPLVKNPKPFDILFSGTAQMKLAIAQRAQKRMDEASKSHDASLNPLRPLLNGLIPSPLLTYKGATREDIIVQITICLGERLKTWILLNKPSKDIEAQFQMIIEQWKSMESLAPNVPQNQATLASVLIQFANWKIQQKQRDALPLLEKAISLGEDLVKQYPEIPAYKMDLADAYELIAPMESAVVPGTKEEKLKRKKVLLDSISIQENP